MNNEQIKGKILHKLSRRGNFKASHTSIDNLPKGFPNHMRGTVKGLSEEMIKEGLLLSKPMAYGKEVSINLNKERFHPLQNLLKVV
jgi:hypothetical protein